MTLNITQGHREILPLLHYDSVNDSVALKSQAMCILLSISA